MRAYDYTGGMRLPGLRRASAAASLLLAAMSVAACQKGTEGETEVVVIGEPPKVVDPASGALTESQALLLSNVAQGLVSFDATGQIVPGLEADQSLRHVGQKECL